MNEEYEEFDKLQPDDVWTELANEQDFFTVYSADAGALAHELAEEYMHIVGNGNSDGNDQAKVARSVEEFVEALVKSRRNPSKSSANFYTLARKHFRDLMRLDVLSMMPLEFSEEVMLVARVLEELCPDREWATRLGAINRVTRMSGRTLFQKVVDLVTERLGEPGYRKRRARRLEQSRRNFVSGKEYIAKLFVRYARLLVLRIDLHYRDGLDLRTGCISRMPAKRLRSDIKRMFNNARSNKLFKGLVGHIGKIEYGTTRGFHAHLFLLFDGDVRQRDGWISKMLCEYWKSMTNDEGTAYPCNMNKNKYRRLGIGMIHRDDAEKRSVLLTCLAYVTKSSQYIRVDAGKGRNFFHGEA